MLNLLKTKLYFAYKLLPRIFSPQKRIDSALLNLLGLQILRIGIYNFKKYLMSLLFYKKVNNTENFEEDGYVIIPQAIKDFSLIIKAFNTLILSEKVNSYYLLGAKYEELTLNEKIINNFELNNTFDKLEKSACSYSSNALRRRVKPHHIKFQFVRISYDPDVYDYQTEWHSDVWYDTLKGFLFLDDIDSNSAPFMYIKASNKITFKRLLQEYKNSIKPKNNESSTRFDIDASNPNIIEFSVPKNSLIIANTIGIHRRKKPKFKGYRDSIFFSVRLDPFSF